MTVSIMKLEDQQEIFISNPIMSKDPVRIPQSAIPKQMWLVAPVKFLLLGCSGAWSSVWTKLLLGQTNSCVAQGRGHEVGGWGGAHPFLPHTPHHPTPQCHFTSDLIHSTHTAFMFTLTSFPRCQSNLWKEVFHHGRHKTLQNEVKFCVHNVPFFKSRLFTSSSHNLPLLTLLMSPVQM